MMSIFLEIELKDELKIRKKSVFWIGRSDKAPFACFHPRAGGVFFFCY